ncbi:MAG: ABC transporter permease, partial [Solirubrobacteraceae bacterium]|nr:ABC transporter permease [Solirubrobacteraceae bacterium]
RAQVLLWPRDTALVAGLALSELRHRRSLLVVTVITIAFIALYGWGTFELLDNLDGRTEAQGFDAIETARGAGYFLLGIAVFATFSLASVLAVFTTMSTVKGEAEQGLLQPLLVRPLSRSAIVAGRVVAATIAGGIYSAIVVTGASLLTSAAGGEPPGNLLSVILGLTGAVAVVAAFGVLLSTVFGTAATGMAATMLVSFGFFASLVRQIADQSPNGENVAHWAGIVTDVLGFNALYEGALGSLTDGVGGLTGLALQLGPFGQQRDLADGMVATSVIELLVLIAAATWRLRRLDL